MGARKRTVAQKATISQVADLNQIDAFVRVMEAGSFSAAARTVGLPKSSLSRAVAKLEQQLGVLLIQRTTRKLQITDAGQQYLEQARLGLSMLSEAQQRLREEAAEPSGLVRLTAAPDPSGTAYAPLITEFVRRYPRIRVELLFTQRRIDLVAEGVDLAVRALAGPEDSGLVGRLIGRTPFGLFAAPSYLAERGTPKRFRDLGSHQCVLFRSARDTSRWTLQGKRGAESVQVEGLVSLDELSSVVHFAVLGAGIALVPRVMIRAELERGALVPLLADYRQEGPSVYLVHPENRHMPRRVALLRDHMYEGLKAYFARCLSNAQLDCAIAASMP